MDKMKKRIIGSVAAIIALAAIVLAVYVMLNKQANRRAQESALPTTEVGKILAKDLETKYPETATEVVKLYWRINRCLYNGEDGGELSDKDVEAVLKQLRALYDDEMLADENNSYDKMLENLKKDIDEREDTISATVVQKNSDLEIQEIDGRECTTVMTSTLLKEKGKTSKLYENFMCRRDGNGNWKILGWQQVSAEEAGKVDIE